VLPRRADPAPSRSIETSKAEDAAEEPCARTYPLTRPELGGTGAIGFHNVTVRYNGSAVAALTGVSFQLASAAVCGVVGRTGSGKSTLAKALFRVVVPEMGHITLDGCNTACPPLERLRRSMAMVPQDPTLFQVGTKSPLPPCVYAMNSERLRVCELCFGGTIHASAQGKGQELPT
jgi:ABC-type multidrug transport system fused ATPase/permease subunit